MKDHNTNIHASPGFEPRPYGTAVSVTNHYTGLVAFLSLNVILACENADIHLVHPIKGGRGTAMIFQKGCSKKTIWGMTVLRETAIQFSQKRIMLLTRYVTMDENMDPLLHASIKKIAEWTAAGESYPKRPKTRMSSGKVMASVFWDAHGIL
ncbi:hypothetical protein TNCV_1512751 [Trichonephila clavipes]|nr:hypothetical protein TNCV_1512751 [Trichonephila clavipes]